jgi:hypothetical protein
MTGLGGLREFASSRREADRAPFAEMNGDPKAVRFFACTQTRKAKIQTIDAWISGQQSSRSRGSALAGMLSRVYRPLLLVAFVATAQGS